MSTKYDRREAARESKTPTCEDCGYNPTRTPDALREALADAGYERPYIEVSFGIHNEGRALLCPVCGNLVRRTD